MIPATVVPYIYHFHRDCFFTMKDAKSTTTFVQALNESLESGALMCQLYNGELSKYIMNLTNDSTVRFILLNQFSAWNMALSVCIDIVACFL